jgi:hypothetical protein
LLLDDRSWSLELMAAGALIHLWLALNLDLVVELNELLEELAVDLLLEGSGCEPSGFARHDELRHRAQQHGVRWRLAEDDPGDAHGVVVDKVAVQHANVSEVCSLVSTAAVYGCAYLYL